MGFRSNLTRTIIGYYMYLPNLPTQVTYVEVEVDISIIPYLLPTYLSIQEVSYLAIQLSSQPASQLHVQSNLKLQLFVSLSQLSTLVALQILYVPVQGIRPKHSPAVWRAFGGTKKQKVLSVTCTVHTYILQLVSLAFLLYLLVHWLERTAATTSDNIRTYMSCTDLYYNLQYSIDMGQD